MTMFTTAIPVWLNVACEDGHHQDIQLGPQNSLQEVFKCGECGSTEIAKVNISGSSNANMRTLDEVRAE